MHALFRFAIFFLALASPSLALAAPRTFAELAEVVVSIIDTGTGVLIVAAFVVYFWGIWENILSFGDDPEKRKAYFWWGIIALIVMVSIWGIINLLQNTLFGGGAVGGEVPGVTGIIAFLSHVSGV